MNRALIFTLLLAACGGEPQAVEQPSSPKAQQDSLYGNVSGTEFAFDAPWRLEPEMVCSAALDGKDGKPVCSARYDAIPLHLVFRDYATAKGSFQLVSVDVEEVGSGLPPTNITLNGFHEIERTEGLWRQYQSVNTPHLVCQRWAGDDCSTWGSLDAYSEWDGTLFYRLKQPTRPGLVAQLKLTANVAFTDFYVVIRTDRLSNTVFVRLGDPLPRFDSRWVYGDLHAHSQGTDNEGESGYSHRTTLHAMSALGLEFAFATEHASNSGQFDDYSDVLWRNDRILRDMSQRRWESLIFDLVRPAGANDQVASFARRRAPGVLAAPQLFLGGEVDVVPELGTDDVDYGLLFGNGRRYYWGTACYAYPGEDVIRLLNITSVDPCPNGVSDLLLPASDNGTLVPGRWLLKDVQGPLMLDFARQHVLHLPRAQTWAQFVPSDTGMFGGASRRLATLLREEYVDANKGVAFLAHPVAYESGSGRGRLGPDIVPYSLSQLEDAFKNRAVLGLQLWNEDIRLRTPTSNASNLNPTNPAGEWATVDSGPQFSSLFEGLAGFDRLLLWSVDQRRTSKVPTLPAGQIRKVFLAGGSDAHGDLNYARKGYAAGLESVSDLALGKPRNLVMVPARSGRTVSGGGLSAQTLSSTDVVNGLATGNFMVTDGPIVRIAVDLNGNGVIDDTDLPMGDDLFWSERRPTFNVVVEWKSTPEFGRLTRVDLTVNAFTQATGLGLTYNPPQAGVRGADQAPGLAWRTFTSNGGTYSFVQLDDRSVLDPSGRLRITVTSAEGYAGRRVITINPASFRTASLDHVTCPPDTRFCTSLQANSVRLPSALVLRAVGQTSGLGELDPVTGQLSCVRTRGECEPRVALTNPIWARESTTPPEPL